MLMRWNPGLNIAVENYLAAVPSNVVVGFLFQQSQQVEREPGFEPICSGFDKQCFLVQDPKHQCIVGQKGVLDLRRES